ncbi:unnamed protein product [Soboliphyme baturini]|uniref:Uncharacterized protein n=1 Tax=Soboliphyme baturini TaxID=241478 RepID=A0A183IUB5_9BILA|nr:unnamed protein product [Soboliphyme baturini]
MQLKLYGSPKQPRVYRSIDASIGVTAMRNLLAERQRQKRGGMCSGMVIRNDPPRDDSTRPLMPGAMQAGGGGGGSLARRFLTCYVNPLIIADDESDSQETRCLEKEGAPSGGDPDNSFAANALDSGHEFNNSNAMMVDGHRDKVKLFVKESENVQRQRWPIAISTASSMHDSLLN